MTGRKADDHTLKYTIDEIREKSIPIAQQYGIQRLGLFGSYARGEEKEDSDLDFLISKGKLRGLFQYMGFVQELEDAFGCHVDVISDGINDTDFLNRIRKDEVLLYEAS